NTGFETAQYTLNRKDTSSDAYYYVNLGEAKNIQIDSDQISSATTAMLSNYTLYLANFNSLNKRLGELRDNTNEHGVWSRVFTGSMSNDFGIGGTQTYLTVQAGYDYGVTLENARNYIGVALAYVSSKNQSKETTIALGRNASLTGKTTGTSQGGELAIYNSYIADSGLYSDSILKLAYLNSEFDLFNQAKASNIANISAVLSQEVGYIFTFDQVKGLYITPSGEFSFGYLSQSDFTQTLQKNNQTYTLTSSQDAVTIFKSKVEATLGYFFEFGEQEANHATKGMSLYVGTGYEYDLLLSGGNINYKSNNSQANQYDALKSDGRVLLNVGTNIVFNDMVRVYADFETTFAGKINKDYQVNLGVRIGFGDNPTKEEKPTKEETKAPLSIKSE
ncbi:autotransporter outer membrane beta-barrel domain-containing protein, partial [Helicobacter kayseriensis]|uniref:autotransporter outer membrane beta-barrel domain-containing protein n=1 Tax=Helicobacter kayseriensis TaxID=2905877 RepID=UPI001E5A915D